jgi:hypothetical protein
MKKKGRVGSLFDDFLKKEDIYEDVTARAIKRDGVSFIGAARRESDGQ